MIYVPARGFDPSAGEFSTTPSDPLEVTLLGLCSGLRTSSCRVQRMTMGGAHRSGLRFEHWHSWQGDSTNWRTPSQCRAFRSRCCTFQINRHSSSPIRPLPFSAFSIFRMSNGKLWQWNINGKQSHLAFYSEDAKDWERKSRLKSNYGGPVMRVISHNFKIIPPDKYFRQRRTRLLRARECDWNHHINSHSFNLVALRSRLFH